MKKTISRTLSLFLCLCLLLPLASCSLFVKKPAEDDNAPFVVAAGGEAACRIVYPGGENSAAWKTAADLLVKSIRRVAGVSVSSVSDEESDQDGDILFGNTNRALSQTASASLAELKSAFSFAVTGKRLVIAATDVETAKLAIHYFEMQYAGALGGTADTGALSFPAQLSVTRTVTPDATEPADMLNNVKILQLQSGSSFALTATNTFPDILATAIAGDKVFTALGGNGGTTVSVQSLSGGKALSKSEPIRTEGVLGMCYNRVLGCLTILNGNGNTLSLIDADSLKLIRTVTLSKKADAIAYDAVNLRYIVRNAADGTFSCLNNTCAVTGDTVPVTFNGGQLSSGTVTLCGMDADSKNLYLLYRSEKDGAVSGTLVTLAIDGTSRYLTNVTAEGTPAGLAHSGRVFYIATKDENTGLLTRMTLPITPEYEEPSFIFNEKNTEKVDSSYISSEFLFDVYALVKKDYARNTVLQGACTDGKYGYFFAEYQGGKDANGNSNYSNSETHDTVIVKMDLETLQPVKFSKPLPLGHSNDGCYNPYTGQLVISYCGMNGATGENRYKLAIFVDPETLEITGEVTCPVTFYAIAYNEYTGQYFVARDGINFAILDESFQLVQKVSTDYSSYDRDEIYDYTLGTDLITQGIDCDSQYIYYVLGAKLGGGKWKNYLVVFDHTGKHIFTKIIPDVPREIENIFHIGTDIYVSYNGSISGTPYKPCHKLTITQ